MAYTVKALAKLSGVSVRTLHFYDEIGLLRPAYTERNGYRYYGEAELLQLQQVLFFRELGFELKKIKAILGKKEFDQLRALSTHKQVLKKEIARLRQLIRTIDTTVQHLKGEIDMHNSDMYQGFRKEKRTEDREFMVKRFGDHVNASFEECEENTKHWKTSDWKAVQSEGDVINKELVSLLEEGLDPGSEAVQMVIAKHCDWIRQFWTPTACSYAQLGELYTEHPEFAEFFEKTYHSGLGNFLKDAMRIYAKNEL